MTQVNSNNNKTSVGWWWKSKSIYVSPRTELDISFICFASCRFYRLRNKSNFKSSQTEAFVHHHNIHRHRRRMRDFWYGLYDYRTKHFTISPLIGSGKSKFNYSRCVWHGILSKVQNFRQKHMFFFHSSSALHGIYGLCV